METIGIRLERIANKMCDQYCKWPDRFAQENKDKFNNEDEIQQAMYDEICDKCPLRELV